MENDKDLYYVFLDIDGVLWDYRQLYFKYGPFFRGQTDPELKPESIKAVNFLLETLENDFDTRLVITSGRRQNMPKCLDYLFKNGLKYNKTIFSTPYTPGSRGDKIVRFMKFDGVETTYPTLGNAVQKLLYNFKNNDYKNYVVIDDNKKKIAGEIPPARRIVTDINKESLTLKQVQSYLKRNGIAVLSTEAEQSQKA